MSKVISILKDLGEAAVVLLLIIVALVMFTALVILVVLAIPACIVSLIGEAITLIKRNYAKRKRYNSEDMCAEESAEDSTSNSDDARDTAGTESAGGDDEF